MLRHVFMSRSELAGTACGKEIARRQRIEFGEALKPEDAQERPEFEKLLEKQENAAPPRCQRASVIHSRLDPIRNDSHLRFESIAMRSKPPDGRGRPRGSNHVGL